MKLVVVLSGGGAKGSYQVGALDAISKMDGVEDLVVAYTGVSVGSLNAALAAQHGMGEMNRIWRPIRGKNIYKKYGKIRSAWRLVTKGGARSSKPLRKLIKKYVRVGMGKPSYAGASDIDLGTYKTFSSRESSYLDGLVASSAIPGVLPPVKINGRRYFDGGLLNVTPLGHALSLDADALIIISCSPYPSLPHEPVTGKLEGISLIMRTISMLVEEGFQSDFREFMAKNNRDGYRKVPYVLIAPNVGLGDVDDFSLDLYTARFQKGRIDTIGIEAEIKNLIRAGVES